MGRDGIARTASQRATARRSRMGRPSYRDQLRDATTIVRDIADTEGRSSKRDVRNLQRMDPKKLRNEVPRLNIRMMDADARDSRNPDPDPADYYGKGDLQRY